jgi:hypothetical protein
MPVNLNSIYDSKTFSVTTIEEIAEKIKSDKSIIAKVNEIRKETDKSMRNYLKRSLPVFNLGDFKDVVLNEGFVNADYLLYDIDSIKDKVSQVKDTLKDYACMVFISPSGNGVKFAIKLSRAVTGNDYGTTYMYHLNQFEAILGVEIDKTKDARRLCSYSHDPEIFLNLTDCQVYDIIEKGEDESITSIIQSDPCEEEIEDIANFLKGKINNYNEWLSIGFALASMGERGLPYYIIISDNASYNDSPGAVKNKFMQCLKTARGKMSLGTLYHIAKQYHYQRKPEFVKITSKNPFIQCDKCLGVDIVDKKGNHSIKIVLNTDTLKYDFNIINQAEEILRVVTLGKQQMTLRATDLVSKQKLKEFLLLKSHYHWQGSDADTNMLINWLVDENKNKNVFIRDGLGKVAENIWNFGNFVMIGKEKKIVPWEPVIWENETTGYMLMDENGKNAPRKDFVIKYTNDIIKRIATLNDVYKERTPMILGFVVATLFFDKIINMRQCFPILFLHGETGTGKTVLSTLILNMFGATKNPPQTLVASLGASASNNGIYRMKSDLHCIPTYFDEYNEKYREFIKAMYDAYGSKKASFTNDNQTRHTEVNGSSIFSRRWIPVSAEAIIRCCYIDLNGLKITTDNKLFTSLYDNREDLTSLALGLAASLSWDKFKEEYELAKEYFLTHAELAGIDNRIIENHSIFAAGWKTFKSIKKLSAFDYDYDVFIPSIVRASTFTDDASPVIELILTIKNIIENDRYSHMIDIDYEVASGKSDYKVDIAYFNYDDLEPILKEYSQKLKTLTELGKSDLKAMLEEHPKVETISAKRHVGTGGRIANGFDVERKKHLRSCIGVIIREHNNDDGIGTKKFNDDVPF